MSSVGVVLDQAWAAMVGFFSVESFPRAELLSVFVIFVVGIIGGRITSEVVRRLLKKTPMDDLAVQSGVQKLLREVDYSGTLSDLLADLIYLFIYLLIAFVTLNLLGIEFLLNYLQSAVAFLPRVIIAILVAIAGFILSSHLENIVTGFFRRAPMSRSIDESEATMPAYTLLARFVKYAGYIAVSLASLAVLGVNTLAINILIGVFSLGLIALFVFGIKDIARNMVISIYFQLSDTFSAGESITVEGYKGEIVGLSPLYTKLREGQKTYHVPNTELLTRILEHEK